MCCGLIMDIPVAIIQFVKAMGLFHKYYFNKIGCLFRVISCFLQSFTKGDLIHFGMQISSAICFLEEKRLLHRDIAARNCL